MKFAIEKRDEISQRINEIVKDIDNSKKEHLKKQIDDMSDLVKILPGLHEKEYDNMLNKIADLDESINKTDIKLYNLDSKYKSVSTKMISAMEKHKDQDSELHRYNQRAIDETRKAWELFRTHKAEGFFTDAEFDYNNLPKLNQLVSLLSGWDTSKLTPATNMFVSSVYSEVFSKLKPETRPVLTEMMLKQIMKK